MNKLLLGDSLDVLKEIESESVDLLCTDPPYGYSFMGKSWDKTLPDIGIFKECLRVLKPGAFAFVMSAPRSDVQYRMIELIEKAGFDVGFTPLYHTYASGFPKAQNVHKKLTKNEEAREHELQELWRAVIHSSSPTEQSEHRSYLSSLLADLEQGEQREISFEDLTREEIQVSERQRKSCVERWSNLSEEERKLWGCEVCTMPRGLYVNGAKRWICYGTPNHSGDFTWEVADENGSRTSYKSRLHGQSFGKLDALCKQCRAQKIRTLNGAFSGWQPKPAVEVIIVAMKPLSEKTYVDQALKNGRGITWLDDCRIPTDNLQGSGLDETMCECGHTPTQSSAKPAAYISNQDEAASGQSSVPVSVAMPVSESKPGKAQDATTKKDTSCSDETSGDDTNISSSMSGSGNETTALSPRDTNSTTSTASKTTTGREICNSCGLANTSTSTPSATKSASDPNAAQGRFAPNLLVSDDVLNDGRVTKSTGGSGPASKNWKSDGHTISGSAQATGGLGDSGSYSRYFDLDKWASTLPFLIVPKASKREKNAGLENVSTGKSAGKGNGLGRVCEFCDAPQLKPELCQCPTKSWVQKSEKNHHPTVKPLKLMSYLITLGSRAGDVVLDPFLGSGTTALAAKQLGRKYIGIEREAEYMSIAQARLDSIQDSLI